MLRVLLTGRGHSFLDNAARVADIKYVPTTDDILRARLRTLGVEEHRLTMETGTWSHLQGLLINDYSLALAYSVRKGQRVGVLRCRRSPWPADIVGFLL